MFAIFAVFPVIRIACLFLSWLVGLGGIADWRDYWQGHLVMGALIAAIVLPLARLVSFGRGIWDHIAVALCAFLVLVTFNGLLAALGCISVRVEPTLRACLFEIPAAFVGSVGAAMASAAWEERRAK